MLERTIPHPASLPAPPAAVARILAQFDRRQLEGFIEVAIGLLDVADGEPDAEDDDPAEDGEGITTCDERGQAYCGHTLFPGQHDDDEDDDPLEVAALEDVRAVMEPPGDWGRAWNASIRGEDMEDSHDREMEDHH